MRPPTRILNSFIARRVRGLALQFVLILSLLLQLCPPSLAAPPVRPVDAPRGQPVAPAPAGQEEQPTGDGEDPPGFVAADVELAVRKPVLKAGSATQVNLVVTPHEGASTAGLTLTLDLPPGLATAGNQAHSWTLPPIPPGDRYTEQVTIKVDREFGDLPQAVSLRARVDGDGQVAVESTAYVAIVEKRTGKPDPMPTLSVGEAGGGLSNDYEDISLIVPPGHVGRATQFAYAPLYDWRDGEGPAPGGTIPAPGGKRPQARQVDGVEVFKQWQLTAQQGDTDLHELEGAVQLTVDLADLVAGGIASSRLKLWTRETSDEPWQRVFAVRSDDDILTAWVTHFSEFSLGDGLTQGKSATLPSTKAFTVDALNGAATAAVAIAAPPGAGGMAPNLSLTYSSLLGDDLYRTAGANLIEVQASTVGYGWHLSGISYIERADGSARLDSDAKKEFSLVLNSQSVRLAYQDDRWQTDPAIFARVHWNGTDNGNNHDMFGWTIFTPDGTRYDFGDEDSVILNTATRSAVSRTGSAFDGGSHRVGTRWYLRRVTDTAGNVMDFHYEAEEAGVKCDNKTSWYTRAIRPKSILYGGNVNSGLESKLRVLFTYNDRNDTAVEGSSNDDCDMVLYSSKRLTGIYVDAKVNNVGWTRVRGYAFAQSYYVRNGKQRLQLDAVYHYGSGDTALYSESFTYVYTDINRIRLRTVDNGWGAKVTYSYLRHKVSCANSVCAMGNGAAAYRFAAVTAATEDGAGNKLTTKYNYGPANAGDNQWGAIDNGGAFLGFVKAKITTYNVNSTGSVARFEFLCSYAGGDEQLCNDTNGSTVDRDNPDPRRGRLRRHEVWSREGGTQLAVTEQIYRAYWLTNWEDPSRHEGTWLESRPEARTFPNGDNVVKRPVAWIRLEQTISTVDGASNTTLYSYVPTGADPGVQPYRQQYGNVTAVREYNGTKPLAGNLLRTTTTDFFPNDQGTKYLVSLPARTQVQDAAGACLSESRTIYGTNNAIDYRTLPPSAQVRRIQRAVRQCSTAPAPLDTDPNWQVTILTRDAYGNVTEARTIDGTYTNRLFTTDYDGTFNVFPIKQTMGVLSETATYYGVDAVGLAQGVWGAQRQYCGADGICTTQTYDQFGRATEQFDNVSSARTSWTYAKGTLGAAYTVLTRHMPYCDGTYVREHYNGLGQLVARQSPAPTWKGTGKSCVAVGGSEEVHVNYRYGALGQLTDESLPVQVLADTSATGLANIKSMQHAFSAGSTRSTYDAVGRPVTVTAPNGKKTTHTYGSRVQQQILAGGNAEDRMLAWTKQDPLGNPQLVRNYTTTANGTFVMDSEVVLKHDAMGNLLTVTQAENKGVTTLTYDLLGRKLSLDDPDLGKAAYSGSRAWTYAYDMHGNLVRQVDGRGQTTCLYYDANNRLLKSWYPTGTGASCPQSVGTPTVQYEYDRGHSTTNRSQGKLTRIWYADNTFSRSFTYNKYGQVARETVAIKGAPESYSVVYSYDAYMRNYRIRYPDGDNVDSELFNALGLPTRLESSQLGVMVDAVDYDEFGRLREMRLPPGGPLYRTQQYYPWTAATGAGQLREIRVGTSSNEASAASYNRLRYRYTYDAYANLTKLDETFGTDPTQVYRFTYDDLNRVTSAYGRQYSWTPSGNFAQFEGRTFTYDAWVSHSVKRIDGANRYAYDGNGNMQRRRVGLGNEQQLLWDQQNRLQAVQTKQGAPIEAYSYDPSGVRIKKVEGATTWYYPFPFYEVKVETGTAVVAAVADVPASSTAGTETGADTHAVYLPYLVDISRAVEPSHELSPVEEPPAGTEELSDADDMALEDEADVLAAAIDGAVTTIIKYYRFGGGPIAVSEQAVNGSKFVRFIHTDHLGSTALTTTYSNSAIAAERGYTAYGFARHAVGTTMTDRGFTGQQENGSGLIYFNARYYDPEIGQFVSPDTIVPDPGSVLAYNRYMYALGNPLKYSDPSGHFSEDQLAEWLGNDWATILTNEWKEMLLDTPSSEIPAGQLGDLIIIGGSTQSYSRGVLVLDQNEHLALWDVDAKTVSSVRSVAGSTPNILGLFRYTGNETASPSKLHEFDYLPAFQGQGLFPHDSYAMTELVQTHPRGYPYPGMLQRKDVLGPQHLPVDWWASSGFPDGRYVMNTPKLDIGASGWYGIGRGIWDAGKALMNSKLPHKGFLKAYNSARFTQEYRVEDRWHLLPP